jgi:transposase
MTTETTEATSSDSSVGATTDITLAWHQINWQQAERNVRRLQARIVQATQVGKWGKVKALQRLLTHSLSGKALAVRRVTENTGKRTPDVDGAIWKTPEQKGEAIQTLNQRGYHPQPLRRVYIPKSNGACRPLSIPTMRDRAMQALYLLALDPVAETTADPNSYGFRSARSAADVMEACFIALCFYLLRTGCSWRQMPHDLPNGKTVYHSFRKWKLDGTWEKAMTALRKHVRVQMGREEEPSAAIIDSQSIKTSPVRGRERGFDAGEKNLRSQTASAR